MCFSEWIDAIQERLKGLASCVVAFSGGVDSAVVARAAYEMLGDRAVAVTAVSPSLASGELELARRVAKHIGIRHEAISSHEILRPEYARNDFNRCYHCKVELFERLTAFASDEGFEAIVAGTNADDMDDFRPGLRAGSELQVLNPLAECGLTKRQVREIAEHWGLEVWDKPATPCLASRVVYGLDVTPERLERIDRAEQVLRELGLPELRVRCHQDELARIEVPTHRLAELCEPVTRQVIVDCMRQIGFNFVTIDLEGFRSGSFQRLVSIDQLEEYQATR